MLFIPQEKVKETCNRLLKESAERGQKRAMERRKEYMIAIEKGEL